jgi:hypothetical protein
MTLRHSDGPPSAEAVTGSRVQLNRQGSTATAASVRRKRELNLAKKKRDSKEVTNRKVYDTGGKDLRGRQRQEENVGSTTSRNAAWSERLARCAGSRSWRAHERT